MQALHPMSIYWNEQFCAPATEFETFKKSRFIVGALRSRQDLASRVVIKNPAASPDTLQLAQQLIQENLTPEYYEAVATGRPRDLANSNGFSWDAGIWQQVLNSTAGILCAVDDVCDRGHRQSCSLSIGLHHARPDTGAGFCTVNSLAIGALYARKGGRVVVLDLDAHWGGGTARHIKGTGVLQIDLSTSNFDTYSASDLDDGSRVYFADAGNYFDKLSAALAALTATQPDIVFYNAGVDVYPMLTQAAVGERDRIVAEHLRSLGCKTILVMAGGYGDYEIIAEMHVRTITSFFDGN